MVLAEAGYVDGQNIKIDYKMHKVIFKLHHHCRSVANDNKDLVLAVATQAAQSIRQKQNKRYTYSGYRCNRSCRFRFWLKAMKFLAVMLQVHRFNSCKEQCSC